MKYDPISCLDLSTGFAINKASGQKLLLYYDLIQNVSVYVRTICEHDDVGEKEENKGGVVSKADALVEPRAMVVKFRYAVVANSAMLRPRKFWNLASFTLVDAWENRTSRIKILVQIKALLCDDSRLFRVCIDPGKKGDDHNK